jgi:Cu2+-exporting ATPase
MAETLDLSLFVSRSQNEIEAGLLRTPGVAGARLNFSDRRLSVDWRDAEISAGEVLESIERIGYRAHPFRSSPAESEDTRHARWLLKCLAVAGFAAMNIMLLSVSVWSGHVSDMSQEVRDFFHWFSALIALPAAAYAGQPFFRSAWQALRARHLNMDVPISVGVVLALGMSLIETAIHSPHAYFDSAIMLLFFLLCGRYLDHAMRRKTRAVAGNLAALKAEVAHRIDERNEIIAVPAAALRPGDRILVRPRGWCCDHRKFRNRPEPRHRRDGPPASRRRGRDLCR